MGDGVFSAAALAALAVTGLAVLACLLYGRGKARRGLLRAAVIFFGALVLLAGGGVVLGAMGLAWRNWPVRILTLVLTVSGVLGVLFTLGCLLPMEMDGMAPALRRTLKGAVLACAGLTLWCTLMVVGLLALFSFGGEERILEYGGQTLVEVDRSFLDPLYDYYAYHGPLVRGRVSLYGTQHTRLDGNG